MRQSWCVQTRLLRNDMIMEKADWMIKMCSPSFHCFKGKIFECACVVGWGKHLLSQRRALLECNISYRIEIKLMFCQFPFCWKYHFVCVCECYFVVLGNKNWTRIFKNQKLQQERSCYYICICGFHQLIKIREILGNVWNWPYLIHMYRTDFKVNWN